MKPQFTAFENQCQHCNEYFTTNHRIVNFCTEECKRKHQLAQINARWATRERKRATSHYGFNFNQSNYRAAQ
jgi:hypothetical protein